MRAPPAPAGTTRGLQIPSWLGNLEDEDLKKNVSKLEWAYFQKEFHCTLDNIPTENPKNEEKIRKTCMEGKSMPGSCSSGENNVVDEASCIDTIYNILNGYAVEIKDFGTPDLLNIVSHMMKALKPAKHKMADQPLASPQHIPYASYETHMKQCTVFLTLRQLAHTIHRTLCYRKSIEVPI